MNLQEDQESQDQGQGQDHPTQDLFPDQDQEDLRQDQDLFLDLEFLPEQERYMIFYIKKEIVILVY